MYYHTETGRVFTYVNNQKIEPAPVIGEVLLKAISYPLEEHLQNKHVGEHFVCILQNHLHHFPLVYVNVLKCLLKQ